MAGNWAGSGSITVNGNKERLRCRANYTVSNAGSTLDLNIRCAGDAYKFELQGGVNHNAGRVEGNWSETAHGAAGTISGTLSGGTLRASASGPFFSAMLVMGTKAPSQAISITSPGSMISSVTVNLSKGGGAATTASR